MRSSRSFSWMSMWRSKWMMPIRFEVHCAMPRTQGKPIEWSPPSMIGSAPDEKTCATPRRDLVEALLQVGRDGEDVAGVAQRHLLAQVDAESRNCTACRAPRCGGCPAARSACRAIGGAAVERNADHRGVVFADVADVLDVGRLEERVDAGEMRQLAARERRDRLVGQAVGAGQAHVERPLLLLPPAVARQACPRPRRAFQPCGSPAWRSPDDGGAAARRGKRRAGAAAADGSVTSSRLLSLGTVAYPISRAAWTDAATRRRRRRGSGRDRR